MTAKVIVVVLLVLVLIQQIRYLRKLRIATKKNWLENVTLILGVIVLVVITFLYGKNLFHYGVAALGISVFIAMYYKQGVTEDGITIIGRGNELYKWEDISSCEISKAKVISVRYYDSVGGMLTKQDYELKREEELLDMLKMQKMHIKETQ